jgi:hypothetical protein
VAIKKAGLPEGFNKLSMFVIDEPDMELFETFGDGLKEKIKATPEWRSKDGGQAPASKGSSGSGFDDMDDDIPF